MSMELIYCDKLFKVRSEIRKNTILFVLGIILVLGPPYNRIIMNYHAKTDWVAFEKSQYEYKMHIKKKVRDQVFTELKVTQETHSKVREIQYKKFKIHDFQKSRTLYRFKLYCFAFVIQIS